MEKITKKQGMMELVKSNSSKLVLNGYINLKKAESLLNMENEKYTSLTKDICKRKGIKFNNNEIVFQISEGSKKGEKSWLSGLTGTKWYKHSSKNGNFIVIDFLNDDFEMVMGYSLED